MRNQGGPAQTSDPAAHGQCQLCPVCRWSSELEAQQGQPGLPCSFAAERTPRDRPSLLGHQTGLAPFFAPCRALSAARSEEHTSELQSQSNLVCRLLLE